MAVVIVGTVNAYAKPPATADLRQAAGGQAALAQRTSSSKQIRRDSKTLTAAREAAPPDFIAHESKHFVVLSDCGVTYVNAQLALLERAQDQFQRFAKRMNLRPDALEHKLVCVLFLREDEYRAFARKHDKVSSEWISGYYSPSRDWIVFSVSEAIDDEQRTATVLHEAIHQLVFHTKVQSRHVRYPLWICEGLATCFETQTPGDAFGPGHEYQPRRKRFEQIRRKGTLIPLRELVAIHQLADEDEGERVDAVYQQSYALVMWMHRFRKAELREYLRLMLEHEPGEIDGPEHVKLFEEAFGDVAEVERAWLRHEGAVAHNSVNDKKGSATAGRVGLVEAGSDRPSVRQP